MAPGRMPGINDGRIPGDEPPAAGGGNGAAAGAIGTAGMDGLLMRLLGDGAAGAGADMAAGTRGIVGTLSRPVSMLISPYSSSSMAAVGSDAADRAGGGGGAGTPMAGAGAPPRSSSRILSIIAVVSHGFASWPSAPAF